MQAIGCTVVGILRAKPERRDELRAILDAFVAPTRQEEGCVDTTSTSATRTRTCSCSTRTGAAGPISIIT